MKAAKNNAGRGPKPRLRIERLEERIAPSGPCHRLAGKGRCAGR